MQDERRVGHGPDAASTGARELVGVGTDVAPPAGGPADAEGDGRGATAKAKDEVKRKAHEVKEEALERAEHAKEEAKERVREVRDEAERRADRWTSSMGHRADSLSRALNAAADSLRHEGEPTLADLAGQAADQVGRMGGYLEDENPSAMLADFEDLGRRNPGAFLGSAFTLGLAAGRFLRSSRPAPEGVDGDGAERPSHTTAAAAGGGFGGPTQPQDEPDRTGAPTSDHGGHRTGAATGRHGSGPTGPGRTDADATGPGRMDADTTLGSDRDEGGAP